MKKKILIIEDDENIAEILEFIANDLDCEAITSTYALPVRQIETLSPDMVLLDHWLGDGFGGDLCVKLKTNPNTSNIPVIMVSAHQTLPEIAKQYCADDYVQKPFTMEGMQESIRKHLEV